MKFPLKRLHWYFIYVLLYVYTQKQSSQSSANINSGCIWQLNLQLPDWNSCPGWLWNVPSVMFLSCGSLETALCLRSAVVLSSKSHVFHCYGHFMVDFPPVIRENSLWWVSWILKVHTKFTAVSVPLSVLLPRDCRHKSTASPTAAILTGQEMLMFPVLKQTSSTFPQCLWKFQISDSSSIIDPGCV